MQRGVKEDFLQFKVGDPPSFPHEVCSKDESTIGYGVVRNVGKDAIARFGKEGGDIFPINYVNNDFSVNVQIVLVDCPYSALPPKPHNFNPPRKPDVEVKIRGSSDLTLQLEHFKEANTCERCVCCVRSWAKA